MPAKVDYQKTLLDFALEELKKTMQEVQKGKTPNISKLQEIYSTLSEAELKRSKGELSEKEMEKIVESQVKKIKRI